MLAPYGASIAAAGHAVWVGFFCVKGPGRPGAPFVRMRRQSMLMNVRIPNPVHRKGSLANSPTLIPVRRLLNALDVPGALRDAHHWLVDVGWSNSR